MTADASRSSTVAMLNYYHGTDGLFNPGDRLVPSSTSGVRSTAPGLVHYDPDLVYLTTEDFLAERYAVGFAGRSGGAPHVYEVIPEGGVEPDPEFLASGFGSDQWTTTSAVVVREVPLPGLVRWENGFMMRAGP